MGKFKRAILLSFRTKVILPIIGVMVLLMATSMWLVNQRVTRQLQSEAAQQLTTADAVLRHSQQMRMDNVLSFYRKIESESRFRAIATLFNPDSEQLSEAAQKTIRAFLNALTQEKFSDVILLGAPNGQRLAEAGDTWVKINEFDAACARFIARSATNGITAGLVRNGDQLLDVVAVPVLVRDVVVATFVFGIKDTLADDVRKLARSEVLLLSDGRIVASTPREREIELTLSQQIIKDGGIGKIEQVIFNDEHFLCLRGTFMSPGDSNLGYLILSSYEKPLQVLRQTQQLIVVVGVMAIIIGMAIVWIYVRRVTEPLEDLREHAEAVGKGDFTRRADLESHDEFGDLANAFNQMTENLKISRQQLETTVETLKTTQAQLVQSEKLSGIGEFVAGVAHELNNPLTSVIGFSELLLESEPTSRQKRHLDLVYTSALRCQKIVQSLLSFSRRHAPERKLVCVNGLIEAAVDILAYQMRTSNIEVVTNLDPKLPQAMVDSHQIQQVFLNIVNNARQAIEAHQPKGRVCVSTGVAGTRIRVTIQDDGPGIRPENLSKVFDPFFTTKDVGKGTGLGLSLCYGIVKEHNGTIQVRSKPGEGAIFIIEFPIATDTDYKTKEQVVAPAAPPKVQPNGGSGRKVLVIDDETAILQMVTEVLSRSGYQVDAFSDGESALKRLREQKYDLAVSDWKMPGLNGQQVFERMLTIDPVLAKRLIFMTGDVINDRIQKFLEDHKKICLEKPFLLSQFEEALNKVLPKDGDRRDAAIPAVKAAESQPTVASNPHPQVPSA